MSRSTAVKAAAPRASYRCSECGTVVAKWAGRCPECQSWGTLHEAGRPRASTRVGPVSAAAVPIDRVDPTSSALQPTGVPELDRVLGGGLVPGAVVLLAGEPGVGKSTLLLEVAARAAREGAPTLYVTGEESAPQVRLRAERTGGLDPHLWLASENDLSALLSHVAAVSPGLLVVDSVQTISSQDADGAAGGVTQIRAVTAALVAVAKERGMATLLVGHVTKDGAVAGPRLLEHLVDVVLQFEGDRHSGLRMVRAVKNRFGPSDEVGCFTLSADGIECVPDPSGLFLSTRPHAVSGTCVTVTMEGRRPLLAEVQALVSRSQSPAPRRAVSGLDASRVAMVLAVAQCRAGIPVSGAEVYASTVGGMRLAEPATDLALAVAVASAAQETVVPGDLVAIGELGLSGELRPVSDLNRRLAEAARLGFRRAVVPASADSEAHGMRLHLARDLRHAIALVNDLPQKSALRVVTS